MKLLVFSSLESNVGRTLRFIATVGKNHDRDEAVRSFLMLCSNFTTATNLRSHLLACDYVCQQRDCKEREAGQFRHDCIKINLIACWFLYGRTLFKKVFSVFAKNVSLELMASNLLCCLHLKSGSYRL